MIIAAKNQEKGFEPNESHDECDRCASQEAIVHEQISETGRKDLAPQQLPFIWGHGRRYDTARTIGFEWKPRPGHGIEKHAKDAFIKRPPELLKVVNEGSEDLGHRHLDGVKEHASVASMVFKEGAVRGKSPGFAKEISEVSEQHANYRYCDQIPRR